MSADADRASGEAAPEQKPQARVLGFIQATPRPEAVVVAQVQESTQPATGQLAIAAATRVVGPPPSPRPLPPEASPVQQDAKPTGLAARVGAVFEHWKRVMGHPRAVLDKKRERAVEARLREGRTVAELCQAVDGCAKTPHNMGQNEQGQRYDDLELICRNAGQVERFMRNAFQAPTPASNHGLRKFNPATDGDLYGDRNEVKHG